MNSEIKKDELLQGQGNLQNNGQEEPDNSTTESAACECEYCLGLPKPKRQFEVTKKHRWYFQTRSKKNSR